MTGWRKRGMKRRVYALAGVAAVLSVLSGGVAFAEQETEDACAAVSEQGEGNLLKDLEAVNTWDALVERYGRVHSTRKWIQADGTEKTYMFYQDKGRYVREVNAITYIVEDGDVYGFDTEYDVPFRILFINDFYETSYEAFAAKNMLRSVYFYDEEEQIVSQEERDGLLYLETMAPAVNTGLSSLGYDEEKVDSKRFDYTIDPVTKEILEMEIYAVMGEEEVLYCAWTIDRECEEYIPDQRVTEGVFGEDRRTVTVVVDAGTADEKAYTQTVAKGCEVWLRTGGLFENAYYTNPECTEEAAGDDYDLETDWTLYLKRVSEPEE